MAKNKALSGTIKNRKSVKVSSGDYARVNPNTDEVILWNKVKTSHYTDCIKVYFNQLSPKLQKKLSQ